MVNDPIGDALTRIRNAHLRSYRTTSIPETKMVSSLIEILKNEEYIEDYIVVERDGEIQKFIEVQLKYIEKQPAIKNLKRISKPGLRKYLGYKEIPRVLNGLGISIFSTPSGVMTGKEARKQKVGGEYLCTIY